MPHPPILTSLLRTMIFLSIAASGMCGWSDHTAPDPHIVDMRDPSHIAIDDAENPMLSADGQSLAFLRGDHGQGRLMVRIGFSIESPDRCSAHATSIECL